MSFFTVLNALLLAVAVSIDLMICGIAYGINKTETSFGKVTIVNLVNSALFGLSLFFGYIIGQYIPEIVTKLLSVMILCGLGIFKILQNILGKYKDSGSTAKNTFNFREAFILGLGVAIDAMAAGFGAGVNSGNSLMFCLVVFGISLVTDIILFYLGKFIGSKISKQGSIDYHWFGGIILIGLGTSKLFW